MGHSPKQTQRKTVERPGRGHRQAVKAATKKVFVLLVALVIALIVAFAGAFFAGPPGAGVALVIAITIASIVWRRVKTGS